MALPKFSLSPALQAALAAGVCGTAMMLFSLTLPNVYVSESMVLPRRPNANAPLAALAASAAMVEGHGGAGMVDEDAHHVDIVGSRWMAERLLETEFSFTTKAWLLGKPQAHKETLATFLKVTGPREREQAIRDVQGALTAHRDLKTGVLHISSEWNSPELAQQVTNKVVDLLDFALQNRVQSQGAAKAQYARTRLQQALQEAEQAKVALEAFSRSHGNHQTSPDPGVRLRGEQLTEELNLRRQVVTSLTMGFEQAELDARSTVPILSRLDDAYLPIQKSKPSRSLMILAAMVLGGLASWFFLRRQWLLGAILSLRQGGQLDSVMRLTDS